MSERRRIPFALPTTGDQWVAAIASLLPVSLVLGSVAFELVVAVTGLLWLVQSSVVRRGAWQRIRRHVVFWPLVVWMAGIVLSRVTGAFAMAELAHDIAYLRFGIFVLAIVDTSERLAIDRYLFAGAAAGLVWAAVNTLCAVTLGFDFIGDPASFYTQKLYEAERISAFCAYAFPVLVLRLISARDQERVSQGFLGLLILLASGLLVVMKIRTAWLGAGIGLVGGVAITVRGRYRWAMAGGIALTMLAGGIIMYALGYQTSMHSMYDRYWIWQRSLALWLANPIFGVGVSGFTKAIYAMAVQTDFKPYIAPDGAAYPVTLAAHSHDLYLHLLSTTGLWGLVSFFWLVAAACRQWLRRPASEGLGLGAFPFVLAGIGLTGWTVYDSFYASTVMFFLAWMASHSMPSNTCE